MVDALNPDNLTGCQKAAIFLMAMGEDYATQVFSKMSEQEISEIAFEPLFNALRVSS